MATEKNNQTTQLGKYKVQVEQASKINLADIVINHAVESETARVTVFAKKVGVAAVEQLEKLQKQIQKDNKPDNALFVKNGEEFTQMPAYTPKKYEEITKLFNQHKALTEAFEKAMASGTLADFEALEKVLNSQK